MIGTFSYLALSRREIIIIAATCSVIGIVVIVGVAVALCVKMKKRRAAPPQQSCPTDTAPPPAYGPGGAMNPAFAMSPLPGCQERPPPYNEVLPSAPPFSEDVSEKKQPSFFDETEA